jgi:hypothetical protein
MNIIEFLLVGRSPLGSAIRAGLVGCLATALGTWLFAGTLGPLVFGAAVVLILLPVVYLISRRDNPPPERLARPDHGTAVPPTRVPPPDGEA